ncbi:dodecenoyl-CoA isomerase [Pseudogymnoascus australis]
MAAANDTVRVEYKGRVAIITIDNKKKLGALDGDGYYLLAMYMREVATHDEVHITVLTGTGGFFSAGADVTIGRELPPGTDIFRSTLSSFVSNNLNITHAFYSHPKLLVVALNGPAIGLSAALTGFADFVYATPNTFLLTPFSSIGLVAEGGSSIGFVQRLGISKANEALIMSKKIGIDDLVSTGYVNKVFDFKKGDPKFLEAVLAEIEDSLGDHLVGSSLTKIKALIQKPMREKLDAQGVAEVFGGLERFASGIPQAEFRKLASGEKRHKL